MNNILLQNDADVTQTYVGVSQGLNEAQFRTNTAGVNIVGQSRLTALWEQLKQGTWRTSVKLEVPFLETLGSTNAAGYVSQPSVAYTVVGIVTLFAPARSSSSDRAHVIRQLAHAIAGANATDDALINPATGAALAFENGAVNGQVSNLLVNLIPMT